jgi:hypothetical protein
MFVLENGSWLVTVGLDLVMTNYQVSQDQTIGTGLLESQLISGSGSRSVKEVGTNTYQTIETQTLSKFVE